MKKLLLATWMVALTALVGCQQNDELLANPEAPTPAGKPITVSAHILNSGGSRVALTETQDDNQKPTIKVEWRKETDKPETFTLYQTNNNTTPITFTQVDGTHRFTGEVDDSYTGTYQAVYGKSDLSQQNGTLNQEECVYMEANNITDLTQPIQFEHQTAILKATFKVDGSDGTNLGNISDIVMRNVTPLTGEKSSIITITPTAQATGDAFYIFLPASSSYAAGHSFTFGVTTEDAYYEATLAVPADMSIEKGKNLYCCHYTKESHSLRYFQCVRRAEDADS